MSKPVEYNGDIGDRRKLLADIDQGECRWPMNDGYPYTFCARDVKGGSVYCECHDSMAYDRTVNNN